MHKYLRRNWQVAPIVISTLVLASCGHDDDVRQAAVPPHATPGVGAVATDAVAIERAMASALQPQANSVAWASPTTGSAGVLSYSETRDTSGKTCRAFISTRQSLSGGGTVNGQACTEGEGRWRVNSLNEQ